MPGRKHSTTEFGDFQTPRTLAREICQIVKRTGFAPASIIEPTCGNGAFLEAALDTFPEVSHLLGVDRDLNHLQQAKLVLNRINRTQQARVLQGDFFDTDWASVRENLPSPLLILGNPPWVTNSALGNLDSANLPQKANVDNLKGVNARTGKANFDISEWMLRENLTWISPVGGMLAVLCKTSVARRVLSYAWSRSFPIESAEIRRIDAKRFFGASVAACLLIVRCEPGASSKECNDYPSLEATTPQTTFGFRDGILVANVHYYERWYELLNRGLSGWRSGIKHDCNRVFELVRRNVGYENGLGITVDIEDEAVFPLLKSSDLARDRHPNKWLLVPQRKTSESPIHLQKSAPKAWDYLLANATLLDKRGSSIYRGRPQFSIFGVGDYSFSQWKVAISGLYKKLRFVEVTPFQNRPVVLDDTCYFFACHSKQESRVLHQIVESEAAQEFWSALVFWDAKRPITSEILNLLDLAALSRATGMKSATTRFLAERQWNGYTERAHQQALFRESLEGYSNHLN